MITTWSLLLPLFSASAAMQTFGALSLQLQDPPAGARNEGKPSADVRLRKPIIPFGWVPHDTYASRSGKMKVHLATEAGASPDGLVCTLFNDQSESWTTRLQWPFHEAVVSDDGYVVGYSYTCGLDGKGCSSRSDYGSFVVTILGARGNVVLQKRVEREPGRISHTLPSPTCSGLYLLEDYDAVLVRTHEQIVGGPQVWSLLQLSTGTELQTRAPRTPFVRPDYPNNIGAAAVIAGTPLLVVGWADWARALESRKLDGARVLWHRFFAIVQMDGAIVANIVVQDTDVAPEGFTRDRDRMLTGFDHGTIVRVDTPFAIELVLSREGAVEQKHVKLRVEQDKEGRWWLRDG